MKSFQSFQKQLFQQIQAEVTPAISKEIEAAYFDTPRHHFVDRLLDYNEAKEIIEIPITPENLPKYLPQLYGNHPLALAVDEKGVGISSISQPSAVLSMLQKLDIQKGQRILEIGTASGWNATLMAKLVGAKGEVHSIEIISDLVQRAKNRIAKYQLSNVHLYDGDGAVTTYGQTFDRIMFTVGAYDIPAFMFQQLKADGLLLMVLKTRGLFDSMILLQKKGNYLVSIQLDPGRFVPLKGKYAMPQLDALKLDNLSFWERIKVQPVYQQPFWWGNQSKNPRTKLVKVVGITSFLGITESNFYLFENDQNEIAFGLVEKERESVVVWRDNQLVAYGNTNALTKIKAAFQLYFDLGMPSANCFQLKVYPIYETVVVGEKEWLVKRKDAQFLWSLENG